MVRVLEPPEMAKAESSNDAGVEGEGGMTRQIRVFADLADMLGEIVDVLRMRGDKGASVANFVDPTLRPFVEAEHERLKPLIEQMRKIREAAQQAAAPKKKRKKG